MRNAPLFILLFLIAAKMVLQYLLVDPVYELHRDEFLHLDQADHLAWGYMSVPPFTSWNSSLIRWLGNSEFWVRFFPALYGALTMLVVWKAIESLRGGLFALVFGVVAVMLSAIFRLNMLYQPNSFDLLAWTFVYYALIRFVQTDQVKWMYAASVGMAFGLLNKYSIGFLAAGLLPALLLTPQRRILFGKRIYLPLIIGFLIILPNIIWQIQNDLPVVHHMEALARTQLHRLTAMGFLKEQMLFFIGSFYAIVAALAALLYWPPFRPYRFIGYSYFFTIGLFIFFKAKGYYAAGLYPILLAFGAVYLESMLTHGWQRYLRPVVLLIPLIVFIPMVKLIFPLDPPERIQSYLNDLDRVGLTTWEDGKKYKLPQDYADMLGWREMATLVDQAMALTDDPAHALIMCDNYGQAGAVNFYSSYRGKAYTMNADYINWIPEDAGTKHLVRVMEASEPPIPESDRQLFDTVLFVGQVNHPFAREKGSAVYLMKNARINVDSVLQIIRQHELSQQ